MRELQVPGLPPPVSHYADATVLGDQIFVSGLLALGTDGMVIGADDAGAQAGHIFATLKTILAGVGGDLGDVAKLTLYLTDLGDRAAVNAARVRAFGDYRPASTLIQVAGLIGLGTRVEIEAIAGLRPAES
nr:Rid family hydrolase [uncultured Lichenicoccus sp.]